jgi:hypothetical protein
MVILWKIPGGRWVKLYGEMFPLWEWHWGFHPSFNQAMGFLDTPPVPDTPEMISKRIK